MRVAERAVAARGRRLAKSLAHSESPRCLPAQLSLRSDRRHGLPLSAFIGDLRGCGHQWAARPDQWSASKQRQRRL